FKTVDPLFNSGVLVAAADIDGDGRTEMIVGKSAPGDGSVGVFKTPTTTTNALEHQLIYHFRAFGTGYDGGVRVAGSDLTGHGPAMAGRRLSVPPTSSPMRRAMAPAPAATSTSSATGRRSPRSCPSGRASPAGCSSAETHAPTRPRRGFAVAPGRVGFSGEREMRTSEL